MDSLQSAVQLMKPHGWMAVLDLKDAYYSVPIRTDHKKYLLFAPSQRVAFLGFVLAQIL